MHLVKENHADGGHAPRIAWHPAFVEALAMELDAYLDILEFHPETQLTSEPLRIDCVVVKKAKGVTIEKNIAAIFRGTNLIEYKSPGDYVSVRGFYRVCAYACLYTSIEGTPVTDITISIVQSRHPRGLIEHLEKVCGYTVEKTRPGIYTVVGNVFPIQIVDTRRLEKTENLWLKGLSNKLETPTARKIIDEANLRGKGARLGAYLDAVFRANAAAIQEAMKMGETAVTFESVLEEAGLIAKWRAEGEAIGRAEAKAEAEAKALEIARSLIEMGLSVEEIASATKLGVEKVEGLYERQ